MTEQTPADTPVDDGKFRVRLTNFEGPFDLLLQLISQHTLDVTEVALHTVTDDFIAHLRGMGDKWDLDETTEFLVIAATLLDLKAARLLPTGDVEDEDDLALLEARDLLFARLLQYRAYKQVAALFAELEQGAFRRYPRSVSLEPRFEGLLPEVMLGVTPDRFALIAAAAFRPKQKRTLSVDHIHQHRVSIRETADILRAMLIEKGTASFSEIVAECTETMEVVARFLALLELYREKSLAFEQEDPLGPLRVTWVGGTLEDAQAQVHAGDEDEDYAG
ncbi:condensin subunit ScpA [Lentzea albidocapillata subsp. violacea]|uniref:Segregation and condensation protein A n=1 Tax=Lentzea albidocapillata subsp. violacea TaxID=128104 RepID=A0A1G9EDB9_9PSEU|nr:segregation/condensation protein A [Lentzea albidocapillata]SDK74073.1 condensin subunit ScpA [Lentzea albidocapillata subsp. violacea]